MNRRFVLAMLCALGLWACGACGGRQSGGDEKKLLAVGSEVPALMRVDHTGKVVSLRAEQPSLVYFYPKDGTPGCTKEACAFRDSWQRYQTAGVRVIGVSTDSEEKHREFAKEHELPFSLIADPEHVWSDAFGVGPVSRLLPSADARISFLIDAKGRVAKVYDDVDPGVHAAQVLTDAKALGVVQ
jgi:thioredoxin-dependent peroxiredoxin